MDYKNEVVKYQKEFLKDLINLVKIPSVLKEGEEYPFGNEIQRALEYMLELGSKDGFKVGNINNCAGYIEYGEGEETIGVLCHLDVVPAVGDWTNDPFNPIIKNNCLYGRGVNDDKGPTIASYYALKMLKDLNIITSKKIRLILGLDEETHSRCLKEYFKYEKMPDLGFSPDACFPVIYGEKGILNLDIIGKENNKYLVSFKAGKRYNIVPDLAEVVLNINLEKEFDSFLKEKEATGSVVDNIYTIKGKSSHAMEPNKGINAISLMAEFLNRFIESPLISFLNQYLTNDPFGKKLGTDYYDQEMKDLTMNLALINYENKSFKIGLNYRMPNDSCYYHTINQINQVLNGYTLIDLGYTKVHMVDKYDNLVQTLLECYQKYTNDYRNDPFTIGGGTYAKYLKKGVAFGIMMPQDEEVAHMADEYQNIDDLYLSCAIIAEAMERLSK